MRDLAYSPCLAVNRTHLTTILCFAAVALGCARDLELPPLPQLSDAPVIDGITPGQALGGALVHISGTGFDARPAFNRVQFSAGVPAVGILIDAQGLLVRVPPGAGSGPITVSNGRAASAPFGNFRYAGRGELERGHVTDNRSMLHKPTQIMATKDDVFFRSELWGGVVSMLSKSFSGDGAGAAIALPGGEALAWVDRSAGTIVRHDTKTGQRQTRPFGGEKYVYLAGIAGTQNLLAVVTSQAGIVTLATFNAATLAPVDLVRTLSIDDADAVEDAGGGRVVLIARRGGADTTGLFLVTPSNPSADVWIAPPGGVSLAGYHAQQPLAVATLSGGHHLAVALDDDGNLATADLDVAPSSLAFSSTPIDVGLTFEYPSGLATSGRYVALSKRSMGLVLGFDVETRSILWSVSTPSPGPATAIDGAFKIASLSANEAIDVNALTGVVTAKMDLGQFPGVAEATGGVSWCGPPACQVSQLHMVTGYPEGLQVLSTTTSEGVGESLTGAKGVLVRDGVRWAWGEGWVEAPAGRLGFTPHTVLFVVADATGGWVVHTGGLARVESTGLLGTASFSVEAARPPTLLSDGRVLLAWQAGGHWNAAFFARADALTGQAPVGVALPVEADVTLSVDDEAWVIYSGEDPADGSWTQEAARLEGSPAHIAEIVPSGAATWKTRAISPNGRMLIRESPGGLQVRRVDPRADMPVTSDIAIEGKVTGVTFNAAGDTAWVVTRAPERLLVLQ